MKKTATRCLFLGLCAACGSDAQAGSPSGVAPDKKLSTLSSTELEELCQWTKSLDDESGVTPEEICTSNAAHVSDTKEECEKERDACIATATDGEDLGAPALEPDCAALTSEGLPSGCADFTVSEFEKCARDLVELYDSLVEEASCSDLDEQNPMPPKSCRDGLLERCVGQLG